MNSMNKEPLTFCHRAAGRIAVFQKGSAGSVRSVQDVIRIGTIKKEPSRGEWVFLVQDYMFSYVQIDYYALIKISEKLQELNRMT